MRIATAAYPITWLNSWDEYEQKLDNWVADAADHGAEFLVFPEYASMELSSLAGEDSAAKMETALSSVSDVFDRICETYMRNLQNDMAFIFYQAARLCGTMAVM